jgi:hypothetical protein
MKTIQNQVVKNKQYQIKSPYFLVEDRMSDERYAAKCAELREHYYDLYHVFLKELSRVAMQSETSTQEYRKLITIFNDFIRTKQMIDGEL